MVFDSGYGLITQFANELAGFSSYWGAPLETTTCPAKDTRTARATLFLRGWLTKFLVLKTARAATETVQRRTVPR